MTRVMPMGRTLAVSVAAFAMIGEVGRAGEDAYHPPDCGAACLYALLLSQDQSVDLETIQRDLSPYGHGNYSMDELRYVAGRHGVELIGTKYGRGDLPLDQPAIAFMRGSANGHFVLLRPVGTTGTMVQVLDPPRAPQIVDYDRLFQSASWTGQILTPRSAFSSILGWLKLGLVAVVAAVAGRVLVRRIRRRAMGDGPVPSDKTHAVPNGA